MIQPTNGSQMMTAQTGRYNSVIMSPFY